MELHDLPEQPDDAEASWGSSVLVKTSTGASIIHVPFYRTLHYPDVQDLRRCGYELARFAQLFDLLEDSVVSHARTVHALLHQPGGNAIWQPERAAQIEFKVRAVLHRFGMSDAAIMLRRIVGRAFPGESTTHLAVDMMDAFFWAALAQIARDLSWRLPELDSYADYLEYPIRIAFGHRSVAMEASA